MLRFSELWFRLLEYHLFAIVCKFVFKIFSLQFNLRFFFIQRYVDGAVSDNMPVLDDNTVTISPFAGESDICPDDNSCNTHHIKLAGTSVQLTADNLYRASVAFFPPNPEILSNMCKQGFEDALRFLRENSEF